MSPLKMPKSISSKRRTATLGSETLAFMLSRSITLYFQARRVLLGVPLAVPKPITTLSIVSIILLINVGYGSIQRREEGESIENGKKERDHWRVVWMRLILNLIKLIRASSTFASPFIYQKKFSFCLCDFCRCLATRRQTWFPNTSSHYFNRFSFISSCSFSLLTNSLAYALILAAYDTSLKISLTQFLSLLGENEGKRFYSFSSSRTRHTQSVLILNLLSLRQPLPLFFRYYSCSCRCSASVISIIASLLQPNSLRILYFIGDFYFCRWSYSLADLSGRWETEIVGYSGMDPRGLMMTLLKEQTIAVGSVTNCLGFQRQ